MQPLRKYSSIIKSLLQIQLQYERVRHTHPPTLCHLDNPVREIITLYKEDQEHELSNLPVGKYIVCGEAKFGDRILETNCFQTTVEKGDDNGGRLTILKFV